MFSLIDRLLFRPPGSWSTRRRRNRSMYRTSEGKESGTGGQYARYADLARYSTVFSQIAGFRLKGLAVGMGEGTRVRNVAIVSAGFFGFFDAPPVLGRYFTASEDAPPDPAPVAVLSHALWTTQFGARRDVLGATLRIDAVEYTIIGVAPEGFVGLWPYRPPVAFVPLATYGRSEGPPDWATTYGHSWGIDPIVRRKPNVTIAQASADLTNALRRSYQAQYERNPAGAPLDKLRPRAVAASVLAERGPEPSSALRPARWLAGVTVIVLLIAAANVANLLLARTIRRRREIAVRVALGVSRRRLFGQLLTEGISSLPGRAAGVVLAVWEAACSAPCFCPARTGFALTDPRTLLFAGLVALGVGVLTGLAPMAQVGRGSLTADLKSGAREGTYQRTAVRTVLLVAQSALSVVLLVGAGLFVRSLRNVRDVRLGFDADSVLVVSLEMRDVNLDSAATVALRLRLLETARSVPGVSHASLQEVPDHGMSSYPLRVAGIDSVTSSANSTSTQFRPTISGLWALASCAGARSTTRTATAHRSSWSSASRWRMCSGLDGSRSVSASASASTRCRGAGTWWASRRTFTRSRSTPSRTRSSTICRRRSGDRSKAGCSCASVAMRGRWSSRFGRRSSATCRERPTSP
jgi:predicted permease